MQRKILPLCLALCVAGLAHTAYSQGTFNSEVDVATVCKAPEVAKRDIPEIVRRSEAKLEPHLPKSEHIRLIVVQSDVVNAYTHNLSEHEAVLCIPTAFVKLFSDAEDELAFGIAHEVGHSLDTACKTAAGRREVSRSASPLVQQRICEYRADEIGFVLLRRAGYSPFAAAGMFGRLEMFTGQTKTGLLAHITEGTHPITPDRIENLRKMMIQDVTTSVILP